MNKRYTREEILEEFKKVDSNFFDYFFPIIGRKSNDRIENLYGTCSYLKNNYFITAGHCMKNISQEETKLILFNQEKGWYGKEILDFEIFDEIDICIFKIDHTPSRVKAFSWSNETPSIFLEVFACGFPHGFDFNSQKIYNRGFEGSISGIAETNKFIKNSYFTCIETSFACPKGISGAPLVEFGNNNFIYGVVIGNTKVSIVTNEIREYNEDKNEVSLYVVEETTNLGMSVSNKTILTKESRILGMNVNKYLENEGLINSKNDVIR